MYSPVENPSLLPVPASTLPEGLRVDLARLDLLAMADQSRQQVTVHEYATSTAKELILKSNATRLPYAERIVELMDPALLPDFDGMSFGHLASMMATGDGPKTEGVSDRSIARDLMTELHPDIATGSDDEKSNYEEILKSLIDARQNEDQLLTQGIYADTVASRAAQLEGSDASILENARYKAWVALEASKSRFSSIEEVNAWRDRKIATAPLEKRAFLLFLVSTIYEQALGADEDGSMMLPDGLMRPVFGASKAVGEVLEKLEADDMSASEIAELPFDLFDQKVLGLLGSLTGLTHMKLGQKEFWTYGESYAVSTMADSIAEIARLLSGRKPIIKTLGSIAIRNLLRIDHGDGPRYSSDEGHYTSRSMDEKPTITYSPIREKEANHKRIDSFDIDKYEY